MSGPSPESLASAPESGAWPAPIGGWRLKAVAYSVCVAALVYLVASLYSGWKAVLHGVYAVGAAGLGTALLLASLNYALRFLRWQVYLRALGHRLPLLEHARIYVSGFALTTTPGKAGEAIRAVFLARREVPYSASLAAMFSERVSDLVGVLLLCLPGLGASGPLRLVLLVLGAGIAGGLLLLAWPGWLRWTLSLAQRLGGRAGSLLRHLVRMLEQARRCHAPHLLALATLLSVCAWGAEAWAFHIICAEMGLHLPVAYAVFVYAASMIAGALSFMPGGLGGAEAAMVALLLLKGASMSDAVAATVLIRLATLWFAVVLGMGALLGLQRAPRAVGA